ncbi:MAG: hypothetical protein COB85_05275 [Bacteroidetes bacterium]|nr:MAG: hypothetical protein COB85_05275 [Bacteroidota bacterium]
MTRIYLLLIICCLTATLASSQGFDAGILTGANMSQVDGDRLAGYKKINGIFGVFVNRKFNNILRAQMEMNYIGKGSKQAANPDSGITYFRKISLHYLEVPLMLQFWWEKYNVHVDMGITYGVLLSQREEDEHGDKVLVGPFKDTEFGFIFGINYGFYERLTVALRFGYSIIPVAHTAHIIAWHSYGGSYNNLLSLTVQYQLNKNE